MFFVLLFSAFAGTAVWAADSNGYASGVLPPDGTVCIYEQSIENVLVDDADEARFITRSFSCTVVGDETIDGRVCKKVVYENLTNDLPEGVSGTDSGVYYLFDNGGTILCHGSADYMLLDFNLRKGDRFGIHSVDSEELDGLYKRVVKADDRIKVKGRSYRRLTIADENGNITDYWVEGIGSANSDYMSQSFVKPTNGIVESEPKLMSVRNGDGEVIFEYSDFATTNTIAGLDEDIISNDSSAKSGRMFDVFGRELRSVPDSGIYIIDGKKYIVKKTR